MSRQFAVNHQALRLAACIGAILAAGCGGGGGGEVVAPPPELLQITTQNQTAVARATALAFGTLDSIRDIPSSAVPPAVQTSAASGGVKHALGKALAAAQAAGAVRPQAVSAQTVPCPAGGSISITVDDRDNNGVPSRGDVLTMTFNDCRETASSLVRGGIGVNITNYAYPLMSGLFTFNQLSVADETGSAAVSGAADCDYTSSTDPSGAVTTRLAMTVGAAGLVGSMSAPTMQETVTYDPGFGATFTDVQLPTQSGYGESVANGKAHFASLGGKISLRTDAAIHDSWAENYPSSGRIVVDGYRSHLRMTVMNTTTMRLELDDNDDGAIEASRDMAWKDLLPF